MRRAVRVDDIVFGRLERCKYVRFEGGADFRSGEFAEGGFGELEGGEGDYGEGSNTALHDTDSGDLVGGFDTSESIIWVVAGKVNDTEDFGRRSFRTMREDCSV